MPASKPVPTADIGCALEKISASGPMPTSRYWLQAPCSISTCLSRIACADPGFSRAKSSPMMREISVRIAARPLLDHALQHGHREGDAGGLDGLEIDRRQQPGFGRIAIVGRRVGENRVERAERLAASRVQRRGGIFR